MRRLFSDFAYGSGPRDGCWWDKTVQIPSFASLDGDIRCDVAVVGAGFTGLSAALKLAQAGVSVVVLEAARVGWGASGRNGGFCCLGGGRASDAALDRRFGRAGRMEWRAAEVAAIASVEALIDALDIDVDRHSQGETLLAHSARQARGFADESRSIRENYGMEAQVVQLVDLSDHGFGGPFHAALTTPIGFGLNPRKYLAGLLEAFVAAGGVVHEDTAATYISNGRVDTDRGTVTAERVIVATNGYSSEDVPPWMRARYMPAQSNVIVTEPIPDDLCEVAGWKTDQMCYDTRHLLHYFRRLPDGRFLFGMRGGIWAKPASEARARANIVADFKRMFPAWSEIDILHQWSGMVCFSPTHLPIVGVVPDDPATLVGFAYHGNGVAMGTFSGGILADLALGRTPELYPQVMRPTAAKFPLGAWRRILLPPAYALFKLRDALG